MSAKKQQSDLAQHWVDRCKEIFGKQDLSLGDRIEIETLCALAIELIKSASAYKLRDAGRLVEIRYLERIKKDMPINCTRCQNTGFINLDQIPEGELSKMDYDLVATVPEWIKAHNEHDVSVCDCCGNGDEWYGMPGYHYNRDDPPGKDGHYGYNGGLCECH